MTAAAAPLLDNEIGFRVAPKIAKSLSVPAYCQISHGTLSTTPVGPERLKAVILWHGAVAADGWQSLAEGNIFNLVHLKIVTVRMAVKKSVRIKAYLVKPPAGAGVGKVSISEAFGAFEFFLFLVLCCQFDGGREKG